MAAAIPIESSRIRPGQYSRHHSGCSSSGPGKQYGKENQPLSPQHQQHERGRSQGTSSSAAQPIAIDPKYRLRGNSPEDAERTSRSKLSSSSSPTKKGLRSRSRSRSRLFGKDKADTLNNQAAAAPAYDASTRTPEQIDADFVNMLDELQVQPDLRRKLLLLTSTVKASMLQGQATLSLASFSLDDTLSSSPTKTSRMPIPELLNGRPADAGNRPASTIYQSSSLLDQANADDAELMAPPDTAQLFGAGSPRQVSTGSIDSSSSHSGSNSGGGLRGGHNKQSSGSASRSALREAFKKSTPNLGQGGSFISLANSVTGGSTLTSTTNTRPRSMSFGKEIATAFGKETPESFGTMLKCTDASHIDIARIKRMRAVLAAESPAWISTFIGPECGGYDAMLTRLDELLAMEWRDEQHDDMLLHELLRCFVALSTTEVGRQALASQAPRPFRELVDLLFSEKRPGDLSTRKLMIELLAILLDLQLPASQSHTQSSLNYLLQLLQNPCDPAKESVVDFIKQTHTSRPFKTYVVELGTICRDYFWIFCHSQNRFWRFEELQDRIDSIRGPKVPGGMTGGVEFEAMSYITVHLGLINAIATILGQVKAHQLPKPVMTAVEFHEALFTSGIEKVLGTLRRASQSYYSNTHLEVSRYMWLARGAGVELPYHLTDWIESPKLKQVPLLPPLDLAYLSAPSQLPPVNAAMSAASGATGGYGIAGAFIAPSAPATQSSFKDRAAKAATGTPWTISRSNAMRSSQSPTKGRSSPKTQASTDEAGGYWDFDSAPVASSAHAKFQPATQEPQQQRREVEVVGFERRLDSQFSLYSPTFPSELEAAPGVGMPSSSTSKRILGLNEAVSQDLTNTIHHHNKSAAAGNKILGEASVVGSAVKKWESMSICHRPQASPRDQGRGKASHLR
ncbi:hypothetical protein NDA17_006409 [Ustilago hordei]|nr:hypothetical protein NDA17_006409 [Ustilago hordei]